MKNFRIRDFLAKHKLLISILVLCSILSIVLTVLETLSFAQAIEYLTLGGKDRNMYLKAVYCLVFAIGVTSARRFVWYSSSRVYFHTSSIIMASLNLELAKQAFKLNSLTFNEHSTGIFTQRIVSDPEKMMGLLADILDIITTIITNLIIIIYITVLSPYVGLVIIGSLAVAFVIETIRIKKMRKNKKITAKAGDKINSITTEIVKSEKDIKAMGLESKLSEVSKASYTSYQRAQEKSNACDCNHWSLRNLIIETMGIVALILGVYLIDKGLLTLATFMVIYGHRDSSYSFVWSLGNLASNITQAKVCRDRMASLFDEKEFVTEKFGTVHKDDVKGIIDFKDVAYTFHEYETEEEDEENPKKKRSRKLISSNKIFDNLSFHVEPNTTVAFVGKSGSGKSTILNLMSKMYVVDDGEVLIDGININDFDKATLRKTISLVNQFPYIFDMTIKENLLLAKENASDDEIENAIKRASLEEFIASLPKGLETKVGEGGIKLSGGQRQRLAIARALLRNSTIIIFDESTSSLDNFAQNDIKKSIDQLKGQSTIVIVAHRLSTIKDADKIFFLDEGKILDTGTFEELFARNKKFKNMFLAENI